MRFPIFPVLLSLLLLAVAPLSAQEATGEAGTQGEEGAAFFESVDVRVVNVDVYVTDKDGNPVTGLTRDDFEILENKRPVAITNFYAVESGTPVAGAPAEPEEADAPPGRRRTTLPRIPEEQRLHLIIYVDNFNIRPFNRNRVFRRVREFLNDHVDRNDRVMLISYDRSLHVRHPFTSDPALVANALFDLEKLTGFGVHHDSEWRDILRAVNEAESISEAEWRVTSYAESRYNDLLFTIDALQELIGTLGGLDGRKALLYVSDGLSMSPGEEFYHLLLNRFSQPSIMARARDYHLGSRFQKLADFAGTNRVVFYTIDAGGLRTSISTSVEIQNPGPAGQASFLDQIYISNLQSPLRFLADETGGLSILNTNDVGPGLDRVAKDFDTYYSLGYSPSHVGDGRLYRIDVELKNKPKGWDVRHREAYRDKSVYARMADITNSTLLYGYYQNPMDVAVKVGSASPADKRGQYHVDLQVEIPMAKVVMVPQQKFHVGRLKLFFSAMDEDGDTSDVAEVPLQLRIPNEEIDRARQASYRYSTRLLMRSGGHRIAVGVRDEIGAVNSFVIQSLRIGS